MPSFKSCGLNIAVDGNEDHLIHCFKKDQTYSAGAERLNVMAGTNANGREDPFNSQKESDMGEAALIVELDIQ